MSSAPAPDAPPYRDATVTDPNDPEVRWLREVYQGDHSRQLTVRAVIAGMLLGGVMSLSNLYIALKTGWSFGVTITAGILAYVIFGALKKLRIVREEFGMLENNAMQSVASAAGYMTGGGTAAAIPALMMATQATLPWYVIFLWITSVAMMGVFMAIPMKRQMINQEGLKFPSGIAAAETLRGLHPEEAEAMDAHKRAAMAAHGLTEAGSVTLSAGTEPKPGDGQRAGRALLWGGVAGAGVTWLREAKATWIPYPNLPEMLEFPYLRIQGLPAARWTVSFDTSLLLLAAGAIMGWRSAWSMMLGAVVNYFFLAPYGVSIGAIPTVGYRAIVGWTVWFGSSFLLTAGLLSFAFSWRQVARAFADLGRLVGKRGAGEADPLDTVEVPMRWFAFGMAAFMPLVAFFAWKFFGMALWMSILCIVMSFFIAVVAARATGETDTTPTGAMGKITQLTYGALAPSNVATNLMAASITAGAAGSAADLLTDLKSGYLLGANPRKQFLAQLSGTVVGTAVVVPAFYKLVPDPSILGSDRFPAPSAQVWKGVAELLARGVHALHPTARWGIAVGVLIGLALPLLELAFPKHKKYLPSAMGVGLALVIPCFNSISMFVGALIAAGFARVRPKAAEEYVVPVASGLIAGESLLGVAVALLAAAGYLR